jgi:phosphonate transport system permease protein
VIWESPTLPEDPIVWRKDLDPVVKEKLRQFFLTYGRATRPEAAQQRKNLERLSMGGFKPADNTHLLVVREMEALEQPGSGPRERRQGQGRCGPEDAGRHQGRARRRRRQGRPRGRAGSRRQLSATSMSDSSIPAAPRRSASAWGFDLLVWGGVAALLVISFRPAEIDKFPQLFTQADKMHEFARGFFAPFTDPKAFMAADWGLYVGKMWQTIQMALWGTALAIVVAIPLGLLGARNITPPWIQQPVRRLLDLIRSIPDLVVALIFITAVGLGPFAGVMALMFNTGGVLAKLFAEAVESIDKGPVEGVRATGAVKLQEIVWGVIPQVAPLWTSYALYRFESSSRSATVLGLIGAGGVGQVLLDSINAFQYDQTGCIVLVIVVAVSMIDLLSQIIRTRLL